MGLRPHPPLCPSCSRETGNWLPSTRPDLPSPSSSQECRKLGSTQWAWGRAGCLPLWIRLAALYKAPFPSVLPLLTLLFMAFLPAGVCTGPHMVPVGAPPPPIPPF